MEKSTLLNWIIGPEILWLGLYAIAVSLARMNTAPPHPLDNFLANLHLWVSLAAVMSFALYFAPFVEKNWLLGRIWLVCLVGGHHVLDKGLQGHSEQGPGIGTVYIVGMILLFVALVAGSIFVKIKF